MRVNVAHHSLQFTDPPKQKLADAREIFSRAARRAVRWFTGTEATGGDAGVAALRAAARDFGYKLWLPRKQDCWIAVDKSFVSGAFDPFFGPVLAAHGGVGMHGLRGVVGVEFGSVLGSIAVLAGHYSTHGAPGQQFENDNKIYADIIAQHAKKLGRGQGLVFYHGDQNIIDRDHDTFFGQPLTSAWDELGRYENTGHGNIDVIASYDRDRRVKAIDIRALDDKEFPLYGDHFLVEATYEITPPGR